MLRGEVIELRLVEEGDLRQLYELMSDLSTRGAYFPLGVMSEPALRAAFAKNGFWDDDEGMLVMVKDNTIVGEIEFFPITHYLQGYEISYQLFGDQHAGRGCGPGRARRAMGVNRDLPACPITAGVMIRGGGLSPAHRASYHERCEAGPQ